MLYLSCLKNISFFSPSTSLWNFKGYPCTTFISSFTLLFPFITSTCPQITLGTFVLQALAEEDSCLQHTLISPPSALLQVFNPCLTPSQASQEFEWLISDFRPKYTSTQWRVLPFVYFLCHQSAGSFTVQCYSTDTWVCKLLPHVPRVSANQEVQPIIITIPKPVWAFKNISTCRMRMLDLQKMLYCFKRKCYIASRWEICMALCVMSRVRSLSRCQEGLAEVWAQQEAKRDTATCDSRVLQKLCS